MKKISALILCFIFCFSLVSLGAEDFSGVNNDAEITVKGIFSSADAPVTLLMLNPGKTMEDLTSEYDAAEERTDSLSALAWFGQTLTDKEGSFTILVRFPETAPAGDYALVAVCGEEKSEGMLRYVSNANKIKAIDGFCAVSSVGELESAITDYSFTLSIFEGDEETNGLYEKYKEDERFFNIFKDFGTYSSEIEELNNSAAAIKKNLEVALKLVETEEIEDLSQLSLFVSNNENIFGLDLSQINDENHDYVYENILKLENIDEASDIQKVVDDSIILYGIRNAKTWGLLKSIYEKYSEELEITVNSSSVDYTSVYRALYNERNSIDSVEEAVSEFNRFCKLYPKKSPSSGGGGGGGGGSVSKVPDSGVVSAPIVTTPEKEEIKEEVKEEIKEKEMKFSDVGKDFWAYASVKALFDKGIIKGKTEDRFGANDYITREEAAAIAVRAFGLSLKNEGMLFKDVSSDAWYAPEVMIASSNGIIKGYPDGTFGAGKNISRQDLAVILYNAVSSCGKKLEAKNEKSFGDEGKISSYALSAVKEMSGAGIINGYEDGSFRPDANATRAEIASLIHKLIEQVK